MVLKTYFYRSDKYNKQRGTGVKTTIFDKLFQYYKNLSIAKKLKFMGVSTVVLVGTISVFFIVI